MNFLKLLFLAGGILLLMTCKKRTGIHVLVYNYALNEPVDDATVELVQRRQNGWENTLCYDIATAITDINGECSFDDEKLNKSKNYNYFLAVTKAYNTFKGFPCEEKTSGFLQKGVSQQKIVAVSGTEAFIKIQFNNLLNPSQPLDSLAVEVTSANYIIPGEPLPLGGESVFTSFPSYGCSGFPFAATMLLDELRTTDGKKIVRIRKRKMGIVTTSVDTVKVRPHETKIIPIDW